MSEKRTYEGMFLLDAGNPDFEAASRPVRTILARNEAEVLAVKLWDERRLAYDLAGRKRGLYVLAYFKAEASRIAEIERDCRLNEQVLRSLILHRETLTQEQIDAPTPHVTGVRKEEEGPEEEHERFGGEGRRERRREEEPFRPGAGRQGIETDVQQA